MMEIVKKHLDAYAAGNWDAYRADLADGAVYEELATQQRVEGADRYIELMKRWKRAFPDSRATIRDHFESEDRAVAEVEWEGTHAGPLDGPLGTIPATNKRVRVRAVIVTQSKDGKVTEVHHYFDLLGLLGQLGVAPLAGAGAPREKAAEIPPSRH